MTAWHRHAACRTHPADLWFSQQPADLARALAICASCPVRQECADAGADQDHGIWGGKVRHRVAQTIQH